MRYAIQFSLMILPNFEAEAFDSLIVSEKHWLYDSFEFDYDYWEWFNDKSNTPELNDLKPGIYHVFSCGTVDEEWSTNWEYGREFDGFVFEPNYTNVIFVRDLEEYDLVDS